MQVNYAGFGKLIKAARTKKNLTQEALAETLGISPTHVKHIESEHRNPSLDLLFTLANVLNISIDDWIFPEHTGDPLYSEANRLLRARNPGQLRILIALMEAMEKEQ